MSVKKFTVVESRWLRGGRDGQGSLRGSQLLNMQGQQCCMGFLASACGVPEEATRTTAYFSSQRMDNYLELLPKALRPVSFPSYHGALASMIYLANDEPSIDDTERKERLTRLFADAGVEVEFVP